MVDRSSPSERYIHVTLEDDGRRAFEAFTRKWVGQRVCLTVGEIAVEAKVWVVIPSGQLQLSRPTPPDLDALAARLRAVPAQPCGSPDEP